MPEQTTEAAPLIVPNWRQKLYKDLSSYMLLLGVAVPEFVQLLIDNFDLVSTMLPFLDDGYKSGIRLTFIILAFLSKFWNQYKKTPKEI